MTEEQPLQIILGLGITGFSCATYLSSKGFPVCVMDTRKAPPFAKKLAESNPEISQTLGVLDEAALLGAGRVIVSPGVPLDDPILQRVRDAGIEMIGDIELFAQDVQADVIAITGSNGKSTVTSLVAQMAQAAGINAVACGNLGLPAISAIADDVDLYVMELSSFQLETIASLTPIAATILNISEDHLDRHHTMANYIAAKQRIYQGAQHKIYPRDDSATWPADMTNAISFGLDAPTRESDFGLVKANDKLHIALGEKRLMATDELKLPGLHNCKNAMAALALVQQVGVDLELACGELRTFTGLPHRCQWVTRLHDVDWFNDSKATNVGACIAAVDGLAGALSGKIVLIAGGQGKQADFSPLHHCLKSQARQTILFGEDAHVIAEALSGLPLQFAVSLEEAIACAKGCAEPGDVVLFAPACASFDMFDNYVHRGEVFIQLVKELS